MPSVDGHRSEPQLLRLPYQSTATSAAREFFVYLPVDYDADSAYRWPVILFLHGAGERGSDGLLQTAVGLPQAIRKAPARYPAIVIIPQVPSDSLWIGVPAQVGTLVNIGDGMRRGWFGLLGHGATPPGALRRKRGKPAPGSGRALSN